MEYQKIINLLVTTSDNVSTFNIKKSIIVHDQSGGIYNTSKQIRLKTSMLRSELCSYGDAYTVVSRTINITDPNNNTYDKKNWLSKLMLHLLAAKQKSITH